MAKVLNYEGLQHLMDRLDLRYVNSVETIPPELIMRILDITDPDLITVEDEEALSSPSSFISSSGDGTTRDPTVGDRINRILNYPGLKHLIERLDLRYRTDQEKSISLTGDVSGYGNWNGSEDLSIPTTVSRITNTELEAMLV